MRRETTLYGPFLWMGFNCLKAAEPLTRRQFTFYHLDPKNSWYSFDRPWMGDRLSWTGSHPVILNMGPLAWESSALSLGKSPWHRCFPVNFAIFLRTLFLIEHFWRLLQMSHIWQPISLSEWNVCLAKLVQNIFISGLESCSFHLHLTYGSTIQGLTKYNLWKTAFKNLKWYGLLKQRLTSTNFTCSFLNTLPQISLTNWWNIDKQFWKL